MSNDEMGDDEELMAAEIVPFKMCQSCSPSGRCRVGIAGEVSWTPRRIRSSLVCPTVERGADTIAQGGWTAKVFDEVLAQVPMNIGRGGVTRDLCVQYLRPVPIERELEIEAWIADENDRYTTVHGEMRLSSTRAHLASAQATFVNVDTGHERRHQEWLAVQDMQSESGHS